MQQINIIQVGSLQAAYKETIPHRWNSKQTNKKPILWSSVVFGAESKAFCIIYILPFPVSKLGN